jgi:biopolymer transport protein TolQ
VVHQTKRRPESEAIFVAGMTEWRQSHRKDGALIAGSQARIDRAMNATLSRASDKLSSGLYVLATVGSIAPFVGLFGTVWGIMHSFIGLASVKQATIAVVAPGIAEALIATAFGLFAAIPATIAYNRLVSQVEEIGNKYTAFVEELFVILQRQQ